MWSVMSRAQDVARDDILGSRAGASGDTVRAHGNVGPSEPHGIGWEGLEEQSPFLTASVCVKEELVTTWSQPLSGVPKTFGRASVAYLQDQHVSPREGSCSAPRPEGHTDIL
jgi:hypothetical protein